MERKNINEKITDLMFESALEEYLDDEYAKLREECKDYDPEYSEKHKRKMKKILKRESGSWKKTLAKVAMVVLCVVICGAGAMQVEAIRVRVYNLYYEITNQSTDITINTNITEIEKPDGWDCVYGLSYLPDGYEFEKVLVSDSSTLSIKYKNSNNDYFNFYESNDINVTWSIDTENAKVSYPKINGNEALLSSKNGHTILWWHIDNYSFCLSGKLPEKEILKIAENVVKKQKN